MPFLSQIKFPLVAAGAVFLVLVGLGCAFPGFVFTNYILLGAICLFAIVTPHFISSCNRPLTWAMSVFTLLLGTGVILNAWYYTTFLGGTPDHPVLINTDSHRWWHDALFHLGDSDGIATSASHGWYGYVLAAVLFVFGKNIGCALLWSMLLNLASLLLTWRLTYRLTDNKKVATTAVVCCGAVCYWLAIGTLVLKDAFIIFALLTGAYALLLRGRSFLVLTGISAVLLTLSRPGFNFYLVFGVILVYPWRKHLPTALAAVVFCLCMWKLPAYLNYVTDVTYLVGSYENDYVRFDAPNQMAFYNMVGNYTSLPYFKKILLLPFTATVQFFIPFPWNFERDIPFGLTEVWAHIAYPWYLFGLIFIFYLVSNVKKFTGRLYRLSLWGLLCWLAPCFLFGGTISRYGLPLVSVFSAAVALTLINDIRKRAFIVYIGIGGCVVAAVLLIAYHLQQSAIS